jgi:hypothetical protein
MKELAPDRIKKIAHILSDVSNLDETDMFILLAFELTARCLSLNLPK